MKSGRQNINKQLRLTCMWEYVSFYSFDKLKMVNNIVLQRETFTCFALFPSPPICSLRSIEFNSRAAISFSAEHMFIETVTFVVFNKHFIWLNVPLINTVQKVIEIIKHLIEPPTFYFPNSYTIENFLSVYRSFGTFLDRKKKRFAFSPGVLYIFPTLNLLYKNSPE